MKVQEGSHRLLHDFEFREMFNIVATAGLIIVLASIILAQASQLFNKAKLAEFYFFLTGFKSFVHEHYAYHGTLPDQPLTDRYINRIANTDEFQNLNMTDHGFDGTAYWFTFTSPTTTGINGTLSITPYAMPSGGSVVWLCGYASHPRGKHEALPNNTIKKELLTTLCKQ